jgi:catalase
MTFVNPVGRVNYEPNSWPAEQAGPREDPERGFRSFPTVETGEKRRLRPESFADHYSQARQFFISQTPIEQQHIVDAFVFELSKVDRLDIRERMVANLRNVDNDLAERIADGLGLVALPDRSDAAVEARMDLEPSPALSIVANGGGTFAGRKLGILVSDGADAALLRQLQDAALAEEALVELVAPKVGGVTTSDGELLPAQQKLGGGPSVLYDAVVVLPGEESVAHLAPDAAVRDFIADAFGHCKFIGHVPAAQPLLEAAGVWSRLDQGFVDLGEVSAAEFVERCRRLRFWDREALVTSAR